MKNKEEFLFLVIMLLSFCIHPSASPLVHSQENLKEKAAGEDFINNKYDQGIGTEIVHQNKFGHGTSGGGGNGGLSAVSGGDGGGSHSPYVQGGGGVTPVYAAGAGNNHHYHHGGGNCDKGRTGLATLAMYHICMFFIMY